MIKYTPANQLSLDLFKHPFERQLDASNRWVQLAELIPWDSMASALTTTMCEDNGRMSIDLRHVMGALIIKHVENLTDEDTIQRIQENIYMQYFVGLKAFTWKELFEPSLFVTIRKRLNVESINEMNEQVMLKAVELKKIKHRAARKKKTDLSDDDHPGNTKNDSTAEPVPANKGILKMDATVAPQQITFPTDTAILNHARVLSENLIDELYQADHWKKKPRTYRRLARKQYLGFSKMRKKSVRQIRKCIKEQLGFLRRNLGHIDKLIESQAKSPLSQNQQQGYEVMKKVYEQQNLMYKDKRRSVKDRIVNVAKPFVRPIVRGKAGHQTEFGAKITISETEGFVSLDKVDFNNFNEALLLKNQVEGYKALFGYYPELVLVDKIYLNRENRKYLKDNGIRHVGPILGKQPGLTQQEKQKRKKEQNKRNSIEGKFGTAKIKYGLDSIRNKTEHASITSIALIFLAMNALNLLKGSLFSFLNAITGFMEHLNWLLIGQSELKLNGAGKIEFNTVSQVSQFKI